jgi:hypothetical protein
MARLHRIEDGGVQGLIDDAHLEGALLPLLVIVDPRAVNDHPHRCGFVEVESAGG